MTDFGPQIIEWLFQILKIDAEWSIREARGFSWWAHRLRQRVWAEESQEVGGTVVVRIHAETDVLRGVSLEFDALSHLATLNRSAVLSGLTAEDDCVKLRSGAWFHAGNAHWLRGVFATAVVLQPDEAEALADGLAEEIGGKVDLSGHPTSGTRSKPDEMLGLAIQRVIPAGRGRSPWSGTRELQALQGIFDQSNGVATMDEMGLSAELAFGASDTSLLYIQPAFQHGRLGSGAKIDLWLPGPLTAEDAVSWAGQLMLREHRRECHAHSLGGWCTQGDSADVLDVSFSCFLPAVLCRPGILTNIALSMAERARWVGAELRPDETPGNVPAIVAARAADAMAELEAEEAGEQTESPKGEADTASQRAEAAEKPLRIEEDAEYLWAFETLSRPRARQLFAFGGAYLFLDSAKLCTALQVESAGEAAPHVFAALLPVFAACAHGEGTPVLAAWWAVQECRYPASTDDEAFWLAFSPDSGRVLSLVRKALAQFGAIIGIESGQCPLNEGLILGEALVGQTLFRFKCPDEQDFQLWPLARALCGEDLDEDA